MSNVKRKGRLQDEMLGIAEKLGEAKQRENAGPNRLRFIAGHVRLRQFVRDRNDGALNRAKINPIACSAVNTKNMPT